MNKILRKEVIIGFSVIVALLILFFGINFLKGVNLFKAANYYYAVYDNVEGLAQSAPVTLNGFKVGIVRNISYEYSRPGNVTVEMSLDKSLKLPQGTEAMLSSDLLGSILKDKETKKESMVADKITLLLIAVVAMFIARDPNSSVFTIVSFAWAGFGAVFGPVVLLALFWRRSNWQGALAGMICGGSMVFIWNKNTFKVHGRVYGMNFVCLMLRYKINTVSI